MNSTPPTQPAAQTPTGGHDANGRFAPGNKGGTGNPFARQVAALRQALLDAVSPDDLAAIAQALAAKAKAGDVAAAKLLLGHLVGKPAPPPNPDTVDVEEVARLRERAFLFKDMKPLFEIPDAGMFLDILHTIRSAKTSGIASRLGAALRDPNVDLRQRSVLEGIMEPRAARPGKRRQGQRPSPNGVDGKQPPSPDGANGKQPPPELMGALDVLLERMAVLDKLQAEPKAVNGNGKAHS